MTSSETGSIILKSSQRQFMYIHIPFCQCYHVEHGGQASHRAQTDPDRDGVPPTFDERESSTVKYAGNFKPHSLFFLNDILVR